MSTVKETQTTKYHEEVDTETGEVYSVIDEQTITSQKIFKTQDEFIQIYLQDLAGLMNINTKAEIQILCCLWKYSTYVDDDNKGNCVFISKKLVADIQTVTKLKEQTIRNLISLLSKKQLLIKDPNFRGTYYLNPMYFFKGSLKDRPKTMKFVLSYIQEDTQK